MAGAASDQAAHAVSDDDHLIQRHGPVSRQSLQHARKLTAVRGDAASGGVLEGNRCVAEVSGQRVGVIVRLASQLCVGHAQTVHCHEQSTVGTRKLRHGCASLTRLLARVRVATACPARAQSLSIRYLNNAESI